MGSIERELATMRGLASCAGDDAKIDEAEAELSGMRAEIERLRKALSDILAYVQPLRHGAARSER